MDRELLIEIGVEEVPASWLPSLVSQLAQVTTAQLKTARLDIDAPVESLDDAASPHGPRRPGWPNVRRTSRKC